MGEDCDGTLTFTPEKGPVIMFGPSCDPPRGGGDSSRVGTHAHVGDAARIGYATAANASDPELIEWTKGNRSVTFDGEPCSFPGKIWKANSSTATTIIDIGGGAAASGSSMDNASCATFPSTDLSGHDGPGAPCSVKATSAAACCQKCSVVSECKAWTWMPNANNCCFKRSTAGRKTPPYAKSYVSGTVAPPIKPTGSEWNMLCAAGSAWARYTSAGDSLLGPWKLQDPSFASVNGTGKGVGGGGGGALFLPLPHPAVGEPTHIIADGSNGVFQYGTYDQVAEKLDLKPEQFALDSGTLQWQAAGVAQTDGRILAVGWVHGEQRSDPQASADGCPRVGGIEVCGIQAISAMRVISFERKTNRLIFNFAAEYSKLRNATLLAPTAVQLSAGQVKALPLPKGEICPITIL